MIDHHEDEGLYKDSADPRVVTVPTGSCSSLVTSLLTQHTPDSIPSELATLLISAILIDTNGLKPGGKAEPQDREAVSYLLPHSQFFQAHGIQSPKTSSFHNGSKSPTSLSHSSNDHASPSSSSVHELPSVQEHTKVLMEKKNSVSHLSTRDLLRRDYKEYTWKPSWPTSSSSPNTSPSLGRASTSSPIPSNNNTIQIGLATVPRGLKDWIPSDPDFWPATDKYLEERHLSALGILTTFKGKKGKGKHKRQMLWLVKEGETELRDRLWKGLEASKELKVKVKELKKYHGPSGDSGGAEKLTERVRIYKQGNAEATRKVTAPIVRTIIEGNGNANGNGKL